MSEEQPIQPTPMRIDTPHVVGAGTIVWLVALLVTLLVPALHTGERDFWPWVCATGAALGALGLIYLRRGRGNAESA